MRSALTTPIAALFLAILAGCAPVAGVRESSHPNRIIVREFAFTPGIVTLDPSLGFSLHRGAPGVPKVRRADTVGRAAAFSLADAVRQRLADRGYDVIRSNDATPEPGGRALIVTGAFRRIYEGHRRQGASVVVEAEIEYQKAGQAPLRLMAFPLDSRRLPPTAGPQRRGGGANEAAARVGNVIADTVLDLARLNHWAPTGR